MKGIKITHKGNMVNHIVLNRTGSDLQTHAPADNSPSDTFTPTDLITAGLGSCILATLTMGAEKYNINIEGVEINIEKIMEDKPRRIAEFKINIQLPDGQAYTDKEKTLLERFANTCVVGKSLHPDIKKDIRFNF